LSLAKSKLKQSMAFSTGAQNGPMADINVTPLVDVMLVLLIIFMVTAPMMQQGVKVDLPEVAADSMSSDDKRLVVTITADKKAYIGKSEVPLERLEELLSTNAKLKNDKELYLHADHTLPYGLVVQVMASAKKAGAENLAMVTDPQAKAPSQAKR